MDAAVSWLGARGVAGAALCPALARFPSLLSFSIPGKLQPTLEFLQSELDMGLSEVMAVLCDAPDVFGRKIDTLRANVGAMRAAGLGEAEMKRFVHGYPGALRFSLTAEPYAAKLRFLRDVLGREVGPTLATHPKFVSYSLERIACRGAFLKKHREEALHSITSWLSMKDTAFAEKRAVVPLAAWEAFREGWRQSPEAAPWLAAAARGAAGGAPSSL